MCSNVNAQVISPVECMNERWNAEGKRHSAFFLLLNSRCFYRRRYDLRALKVCFFLYRFDVAAFPTFCIDGIGSSGCLFEMWRKSVAIFLLYSFLYFGYLVIWKIGGIAVKFELWSLDEKLPIDAKKISFSYLIERILPDEMIPFCGCFSVVWRCFLLIYLERCSLDGELVHFLHLLERPVLFIFHLPRLFPIFFSSILCDGQIEAGKKSN